MTLLDTRHDDDTDEPLRIRPTVDERGWMALARCASFPEVEMHPIDGAGTAYAKAVCELCPVRQECFDYAIANNEQLGVWGGTSERERRRYRRARMRGNQ